MKIYGNEFNEIWNTGKVLVRVGEKNLKALEKAGNPDFIDLGLSKRQI
jgi:hypothetical protein